MENGPGMKAINLDSLNQLVSPFGDFGFPICIMDNILNSPMTIFKSLTEYCFSQPRTGKALGIIKEVKIWAWS